MWGPLQGAPEHDRPVRLINMPGIAGIIRKHAPEEAKQDLACMVAAMRHENSYRGGTYVNEECGLYVSWMSRNGTSATAMPLINDTRDVVVIFHGENHFSDKSAQ